MLIILHSYVSLSLCVSMFQEIFKIVRNVDNVVWGNLIAHTSVAHVNMEVLYQSKFIARSCPKFHQHRQSLISCSHQGQSLVPDNRRNHSQQGMCMSFRNLLLPIWTFCPTHTNLIRCNVVQFLQCTQYNKSYKDGNSLIGVGQSMVPAWVWYNFTKCDV